jgi:hypothetical protein
VLLAGPVPNSLATERGRSVREFYTGRPCLEAIPAARAPSLHSHWPLASINDLVATTRLSCWHWGSLCWRIPVRHHPEAIEQWKNGWRFRQRPSLNTMLRSMAPSGVDPGATRDICEHYGHIVHGDPPAADWNRIPLDDGSLGYAVGKVLDHGALCDELALQGWAYLRVITARATICFPEVRPSEAG